MSKLSYLKAFGGFPNVYRLPQAVRDSWKRRGQPQQFLFWLAKDHCLRVTENDGELRAKDQANNEFYFED